MPVSTEGAMTEPSHPSGRRLELEDRRPRAPADTAPKTSLSVSPLALERWAIVLRRHRAGYEGYEHVDARALALTPRGHAVDSSMLQSLMGRLRSLGRGRKGDRER
jgi:hypothetical protein